MTAKKQGRAAPVPTRAPRAAPATVTAMSVGDDFRWRGHDYVVDAIHAAEGSFTVRRGADTAKGDGSMKYVTGNLAEAQYASEEGWWYLPCTVSASLRERDPEERTAIQSMRAYKSGRDDLAIAAFDGEG